MAEIVWEGALKLRNCDGLRNVIFRVRQRALNTSSFVALTRTVAVKYGWFRKQVHKKIRFQFACRNFHRQLLYFGLAVRCRRKTD